ncbi:MAG: translation elongation factor [Frankiales bacterium]|nr:translation elongation factor [Frankiales bacterium]
MEPDRWAEERRRGMTIDLGYAWTVLPSGEVLGFVDVPGHQRFIGNMLAGLGPAPAVLFVVAADEGWRRQSREHLAAVDALGLRHGLLAVTRCDLADPRQATAEALGKLENSSLGRVPAVAVSGATGEGLDLLRAALDALVARLPEPDVNAPVRLWVDRAFTVRGAGTVITGTLAAGTLAVGDELLLGDRRARVRGLQCLGEPHDAVVAVARVAVNVRGVERDEVRRGDVLLTAGAWRLVNSLDVRLSAVEGVAEHQVLHVGTTAVPVRVRSLGGHTARLLLARSLPLRAGDRALLRDPAEQRVTAGVHVLDADPPALRRRGAAAARAVELASATGVPDLVVEVVRRGVVAAAELASLGVELRPVPGVQALGRWLVAEPTWDRWVAELADAVDAHAAAHPLEAGLPAESARQMLGLPDPDLLGPIVRTAGFEQRRGRVRRPGAVPSLGPAEPAVQQLERRLAVEPFAAPEAQELQALGLGPRHLAAAEAAGRLLRLGGVIVLPTAPDAAVRLLAALPQPFTLSQARQALGTTRRVAVPLLEHLDATAQTTRLDGGLRRVVD